MPQEDKSATPPHSTLEGKIFEPQSQKELLEALDIALDYRGDVTLTFKDGAKVEGFLYRIDEDIDKAYLFVKQEGTKESSEATYPISTVQAINFTGADPAFGKSWDDWAEKSSAQRKAEAERARKEAEKLGHL